MAVTARRFSRSGNTIRATGGGVGGGRSPADGSKCATNSGACEVGVVEAAVEASTVSVVDSVRGAGACGGKGVFVWSAGPSVVDEPATLGLGMCESSSGASSSSSSSASKVPRFGVTTTGFLPFFGPLPRRRMDDEA